MGRKSSAQWWRFCHPYFVLNTLSLASFPLVELLLAPGSLSTNPQGETTRLDQIMSILCLWLALKYFKSPTVDAFISNVFYYTKLAMLVAAWLASIKAFACYIVVWTILFLVLKPPAYEGPDRVQYLDGAGFEELVLKKDSGRWLIYLYATWCSPCVVLSPIISELSIEYEHNQAVKFGKLDLGRFKAVAEQLKVDVSVHTRSLPTFILFENGKELKRVPSLKQTTRDLDRLTKRDIAKIFELEPEKKPEKQEKEKGKFSHKSLKSQKLHAA